MQLARAANRGHSEEQRVVIILSFTRLQEKAFIKQYIKFIFKKTTTNTYRHDVHRHPRLSIVCLDAARARTAETPLTSLLITGLDTTSEMTHDSL